MKLNYIGFAYFINLLNYLIHIWFGIKIIAGDVIKVAIKYI